MSAAAEGRDGVHVVLADPERKGGSWPGRRHITAALRVGCQKSGCHERSWVTPEGERRSVVEIEADEVGASLKFATAKVERATERGTSDRSQARERQAERGDFNDAPPF
jgi:hypothetical protein